MSTGQAIIGKLENIKPIEGADRIVQAECYGETVIVSKDYNEDMAGILFDTETQLSEEFISKNNMYRHSEFNKDKTKSGYIEDDGRVRPIRLKGVKCSGLFVPLSYLDFAGGVDTDNTDNLIGHQFNEWKNVPICKKYITKKTQKAKAKNKGGKKKSDLVPTFAEHFSTDHFMRGLKKLDLGHLCVITEKLHGASARTGYLPVIEEKNWLKQRLRHVWLGKKPKKKKYKFVVGSRRVVKSIGGEKVKKHNSYYDSDIWTLASQVFKGQLHKGETIYFEIVGFLLNGSPIMGAHSNHKLKKYLGKQEYEEFIEKYGKETIFSYGCSLENTEKFSNPPFDIYVYRITMTNPDGIQYDLGWDQVKKRCGELRVKHVPELDRGYGGSKEGLKELVVELSNAPSKNFPSHIREGVCLRIDNGNKNPYILKHKGVNFKILEGIIKESDFEDLEEAN